MKNLGIFYLIFVVLLSALPCSDELENRNLTINNTTIIALEDDDCHTESCSPICLCNCCGQSLVEINLASLVIKSPTVDRPILNSAYHFKLEQADRPKYLAAA